MYESNKWSYASMFFSFTENIGKVLAVQTIENEKSFTGLGLSFPFTAARRTLPF